MNQNENFLIIVAILLAVLVVGAYYLLSSSQPSSEEEAVSTVEEGVATDEATSTDSVEIAPTANAETATPTISEVTETQEENTLKPSISTTPYSVYIGFATDIGTSSAALMGAETGEVVTGYEWEALPGSQLFSDITLPLWGSSEARYTVQVWDEELETYTVLGDFPSGVEIEFPRDDFVGPSRLKITGIDPALRICPGDRSFSWDVRFTFAGEMGLVRTPITQTLSLGETCEL
jgi:cytoskeletal protein RodZ